MYRDHPRRLLGGLYRCAKFVLNRCSTFDNMKVLIFCAFGLKTPIHAPKIGVLGDLAPLHTHPFNGPFSGTTQVSRYQKGITNLDFTEARDSEWHWHQLGHMQVSTSLQTDNHASTRPLSFFTGRMPFLSPNQQHQSTEGSREQY